MKLRKKYEVEPYSPSAYASEEWMMTYNRKDDLAQVLESLRNVVSDYKKTHSNVDTHFKFDSYNNNTMSVGCYRTLTEQEKAAVKDKITKQKEANRLAHVKEIKKEAKRLKLI